VSKIDERARLVAPRGSIPFEESRFEKSFYFDPGVGDLVEFAGSLSDAQARRAQATERAQARRERF
jgi:hypothetical protein